MHGLLTLPAQGDQRFAGLLRKLRLLALRELLAGSTPGVSDEVRRALPGVRAALVAAARQRSAGTLALVGSPDVLPPALAMLANVAEPDAMLRRLVPTLLAGLAKTRGAMEESALWDVPFEVLPRVEAGTLLRFTPPARGLLADASGVEVRLNRGARLPLEKVDGGTPEVSLEDTFFPIPGVRAHLSLRDANPLAMLEDHPDKHGNAIDLGGRNPREWTHALGEAVALLEAGLPEVHAELSLSLQRIVPVGFEAELHLSASYREAPGLIYLTLHPNRLTLAEAIVHETQHGKLNVLSHFDPALHNGRTAWTPSPVRPDLRPLAGVLLAVHAFVPVAILHRRLADLAHPISQTPEFALRRAQVLAGNERGLRILDELGEPTALGREILEALHAAHAYAKQTMSEALDPELLPPG